MTSYDLSLAQQRRRNSQLWTIWTGSRNWEGFRAEMKVENVFHRILELAIELDKTLVVIHGAYERGLDLIIDNLAVKWGCEVRRYPANWDAYARTAGPIRNQKMVDGGADICFGFPRDISRGTRHCLSLARNAGILTFTYEWDPSWTSEPKIRKTIRT